MDKKRKEEILNKMIEISKIADSRIDSETQSRGEITYYRDFEFGKSGLAQNDVYVVEISNKKGREEGEKGEISRKKSDEISDSIYEIYDEESRLIAIIDEQGKIHFSEEYLEEKRGISEEYFRTLNLQDISTKLPEKTREDSLTMTKEELDQKREENELERNEKQEEGKKEQQIAEQKGIKQNDVLIVRENGNLYDDHPYLEPNLYFYKDNDGIVRAEYIDENGNSQVSKYFEPSQTSLREETVSMGSDGNPVKREVPYQVMQTKGLANTDKDIRDVRFNVNIDTYGYLEISEARQGKNGEWVSHDIEVRGRDYNSYALNKETSIETRKADPDKQTDAFGKTEDTGLVQDGIQYDEMYLMQHADEIIEEFIKEGYQRDEAIEIFNLMIGEETLTEEQAKEKVNQQINEEREKDAQRESEEHEEDEQRTQGGDALARRNRY